MVNQGRTLSSRRPGRVVARWWVVPLMVLCASLSPALPAQSTIAQALDHYEARRYRQVLALLEPGAASSTDAQRLMLIGKSYGYLAEQAPWYRAAPLAVRCREYLERAVMADPDHREAVRSLARFLEQAPAMLGGDPERARALRARLAKLQASS